LAGYLGFQEFYYLLDFASIQSHFWHQLPLDRATEDTGFGLIIGFIGHLYYLCLLFIHYYHTQTSVLSHTAW
jgi:hypothetical protein